MKLTKRTVYICLILLVYAICALFLAGCTEAPEPVADAPDSPVENAPLLPFDPPQLVEYSSTPARDYQLPDVALVPLTHQPAIYSYNLLGEVCFINRAGEQLPLPDQVTRYYVIFDRYEGDTIGYMLLNEQWQGAVMNMAGEVVTDFLYTGQMGAEDIYFTSHLGYVVLGMQEAGADGRTQYGLVDTTNGAEIIPMEYDNLTLMKTTIMGIKDDHHYLIDYSGKVVFDAEHILIGDYGFSKESDEYYFSGTGYTVLGTTGELFRYDYEDEIRVNIYAGMLAMRDLDQKIVSIYRLSDGEHLYSTDRVSGVFFDNEQIIIPVSNYDVDIISLDEVLALSLQIPVSATDIKVAEFNDDILYLEKYFQQIDARWSSTYNSQGELLSQEDISAADNKSVYGNVTTNYDLGFAQLTDDEGNIIIPYGKYQSIDEYGPFIVAYKPYDYWAENKEPPLIDVLNQQGDLLLAHPLTTISWEAHFSDAMVVWLDLQTCVLLQADGSYFEINNPPQVTYEYQGG